VSDTSLKYDRDVKSGVYAASRVPEFWVVDLPGDVLLIFRDPSRGAYKTSLTVKRGESVAALAFPEIEIAVADLLGPATE
jgi:Uma2 family endonuclease